MEMEKSELDNNTLRKIITQLLNDIEITDSIKKFITKKNTINNFMFVNDYNIDKTIDHLKKSIIWRNDNISDMLDNGRNCKYCKDNTIKHNIGVIHKLENDQYIIYCNIETNGTMEHLFYHVYCLIEYILNNTPCDQYILIFDCKNITLDYILSLPKMANFIKILKENFPERLKNLLLINTTGVVSSIYDTLKGYLNQRIQDKIIFINELEEILEYCPQSVLNMLNGIDYENINLQTIEI
tara:strand:+ start:6579 stop:7298 length:720 start_codon:yes stop_codon:yes gene_type:complete